MEETEIGYVGPTLLMSLGWCVKHDSNVEVADQQQSKVASGRQARPAHFVGVESLTERLDMPAEIRSLENLAQPRIERVGGGAWQIVCRDPHRPASDDAVI
jgi:hypothetical protein